MKKEFELKFNGKTFSITKDIKGKNDSVLYKEILTENFDYDYVDNKKSYTFIAFAIKEDISEVIKIVKVEDLASDNVVNDIEKWLHSLVKITPKNKD